MAEVVVAFDPGPHTGIATLVLRAPRTDSLGDRMPFDYEVLSLETLVLGDDVASFYRALYRRVIHPVPNSITLATVVCESFITFSGMVASQADAILTQRFIGFIQGICAYHNRAFVLQTPASRKAYEATAKAQIGNQRVTPHELSALSHALRYALTLPPPA